MDINLQPESALGHWSVNESVWQYEFQVGALLIYVQYRADEHPEPRLAAARQVIQAVRDDLPEMLRFAERQCQGRMAELVRLCQAHMPWQSPLSVYAIWFGFDDPYPVGDIGINHDFDWQRTVIEEDELCQPQEIRLADYEPEDGFGLCVRRVGVRQFEWVQ